MRKIVGPCNCAALSFIVSRRLFFASLRPCVKQKMPQGIYKKWRAKTQSLKGIQETHIILLSPALAFTFSRNIDAITNIRGWRAFCNFTAMAHDHEHDHHHHGVITLTNVNGAFILGIVLNFAFVIVEAIWGLIIHSLSLLSDAGHNLADVGALALSLLAFKLLKVKGNEKYTYGYRKTSILVALFNAMVLLVSIGAIMYEGVHRFFNHEAVPGLTIAIIAGIGIVVNFTSALVFRRDKDKDLNVKSAYLHLMADAAISLGLVIGGIVIYYTGWYWVDPLLSLIVAGVILISTWRLLMDSLRLSLDGVPINVNLTSVRTAALKIAGVKDLHHIHIWAISTTENAITAHLVLKQDVNVQQEQSIKRTLKHELLHLNVQHITLETERENEPCAARACDVSTV